MEEKEKFLKEYNNSLHRIGRITGVAIVVLLLVVPFLFGIVNHVSPDWGVVAAVGVSVFDFIRRSYLFKPFDSDIDEVGPASTPLSP